MKIYATCIDISPSEQLTENDEVKCMGILFWLKSRKSFDNVDISYKWITKIVLKKWSKASKKYKEKFIEHAFELLSSWEVIYGHNITNDNLISVLGLAFWEFYMGEIPRDTLTFNLKRKPRISFWNFTLQDWTYIPKFEVLINDLQIIGWYAESLLSILQMLGEVNKEDCTLEVLIDKLPNEQGWELNFKAILLKELCNRCSNNVSSW
jgi:hypothetical protein